jgi:hypothetical protein
VDTKTRGGGPVVDVGGDGRRGEEDASRRIPGAPDIGADMTCRRGTRKGVRSAGGGDGALWSARVAI